MSANPWLVLGEYVVSLGFQIFSFYVFAFIIIKRLNNIRSSTVIKSPCISFYFQTQIITSIINITFIFYYLINWKPFYQEDHNAYHIYFLGGAQIIFILLSPISLFGLGLDRILCVLYPSGYTLSKMSYPRYLTILLMLGTTGFALIVLIIPTFPTKPTTHCANFGCMPPEYIVKSFLYFRGFTGFFIFGNCICLFISMKYMHNFKESNYQFNCLVFYTMLATLFLDIFPNLGGAFLNTLTGFSLQNYIGPYSTVSACIEMGIVAYFYYKMFKKRFNTSRVLKGPGGLIQS